MTQTEIIQIITGFIGSLGFSVLFNIRGKRLIMAAIGGLLSWAMFLVFSRFINNEPINYFIVSLIISVYAEIMARLLKTPTTTFIAASLIPLIPGGSLYYTMAYAFEGDLQSFAERAVDTLKLAAALALGIIVATTIAKFISEINHKKHSEC